MWKEITISTIPLTLNEDDKIIYDEENNRKQIHLFSQSLMVVTQMDGACLGQFDPVRIKSCMDRSFVRMEPVIVTELSQNFLEISMLGTTDQFDVRQIEIKCKPWSPEPPRKGCGDCSRCKRCWT